MTPWKRAGLHSWLNSAPVPPTLELTAEGTFIFVGCSHILPAVGYQGDWRIATAVAVGGSVPIIVQAFTAAHHHH